MAASTPNRFAPVPLELLCPDGSEYDPAQYYAPDGGQLISCITTGGRGKAAHKAGSAAGNIKAWMAFPGLAADSLPVPKLMYESPDGLNERLGRDSAKQWRSIALRTFCKHSSMPTLRIILR